MSRKHLLIVALALMPAIATGGQWPSVEHPRDALIQSIGEQIRLNGIPMQMTRAVSAKPIDELTAHYRSVLGGRVAMSDIASSTVLSQSRGDHFITVTLQPLGEGLVEVLVSVADMPAAREAANRPFGFLLPGGSELLSDMESIDGKTNSRQLVVLNAHGLGTNLDHFVDTLSERGLRPDGAPLLESDDALVQRFEGPTGEAKLVLVRRDQTTSAVLTLISRGL